MFLSLICIVALSTPGNLNAQIQLEGDLVVHDPVMIKQDDTYCIFHTGHGVAIKKSDNRNHWTRLGRVFSKAALPAWHTDDIPEQEGHLWAPDIHFRDGRYHLYYSVSAWMNFHSSIGYATNTTLDPADPHYEWKDRGKVISYENGGEGVNVIDPNVFVDEEDRVWLFYGSFQAGLRLVELDPETGLLMNDPPEPVTITTSLGEGAFVIKGHGYYYLYGSRGICCRGLESTYQIVMGRSENIKGPYLNKEGESWLNNHYSLVLKGDHERPGVGHNGFFTENDTTFMVYHAYTRSADGAPLLNIRPLYIDDEGWPTTDSDKQLFRRER